MGNFSVECECLSDLAQNVQFSTQTAEIVKRTFALGGENFLFSLSVELNPNEIEIEMKITHLHCVHSLRYLMVTLHHQQLVKQHPVPN